MPLSSLDAVGQRVLRSRLEEDAEIERVVLDEEQSSIWIITPPDVHEPTLRERVVSVLAEFEIAREEAAIEFAAMGSGPVRRRVRFMGAERKETRDGHVRIDAELEWQGERFHGSAEGDSGALVELRTAAQAALKAVEALTRDEMKLRLIGVKQFRAFDTELVVASLVRTNAEMQRYVGSVLATADPTRAACLAVLNALNRALGNFLRTDS
ncbi:MAG TPA: hypothetical protein VMN78_07160 [Longimicrobiales bacterium]|nr:hypothetical protein [Longimicrobiales bacterium]